jgi:hypothetical protein
MRNASRELSVVVLTLWLVAGLAACGGGGDPATKTVAAQALATTTAAPAGGGTTTKTVTVQAPATTTAVPAKSFGGALATSGDKGSTPNRHSPAAQCRQAGLSPEVHPRAFASCVRKRARGQHGEARNPAEQCRQAGVSPEVNPRAFGACVQKKATGR